MKSGQSFLHGLESVQGSRKFRYNAKVAEDVGRLEAGEVEVAVVGRAGGGARGRQERVARSRREEVKLHGLTEAESAEVDFTLALVTAGDTEDEQG